MAGTQVTLRQNETLEAICSPQENVGGHKLKGLWATHRHQRLSFLSGRYPLESTLTFGSRGVACAYYFTGDSPMHLPRRLMNLSLGGFL